MGLFDNFPYTNFHELNLDWMLKLLKEMETELDNFIAINALKYADPIQWDITTQYEKNTIVIEPNSGTAYISVQPVPSGVNISNTDYWTVVFDLSNFIIKAAKNLANKYEAETTNNATFASNPGDWLIWNDTLYIVQTPINIGDLYVENGNIIHFTIEDIIGHLTDLQTSDQSSIVNSINEICTTLENSKYYITPQAFGAVGDGVADDTQPLLDAISYAYSNNCTLIIPAGTYKYTQTLVIKNIIIEGKKATLYYTGTGNGIEVDNGFWLKVSGLILRTDNGAYGIYSANPHLNTSNFRDITIYNYSTGIFLQQAYMGSFSDILIENCATCCMRIENAYNTKIERLVVAKSDIGLYMSSGAGCRVSDITGEGCTTAMILMSYCFGCIIENLYYEDVTNYHAATVIKTATGVQNCTFIGLYMSLLDNNTDYITFDSSDGSYNRYNMISGIVITCDSATGQTLLNFISYGGSVRSTDIVIQTKPTFTASSVTIARGDGDYTILCADSELPISYYVRNDVINQRNHPMSVYVTTVTTDGSGGAYVQYQGYFGINTCYIAEVRNPSGNIRVGTFNAQYYSTSVNISGLSANTDYRIVMAYTL